MKINERKQLHTKTMEELRVLLKEVRDALLSLRFEKAQKKLQKTREIFEKRKDIARIATVLREKELLKVSEK